MDDEDAKELDWSEFDDWAKELDEEWERQRRIPGGAPAPAPMGQSTASETHFPIHTPPPDGGASSSGLQYMFDKLRKDMAKDREAISQRAARTAVSEFQEVATQRFEGMFVEFEKGVSARIKRNEAEVHHLGAELRAKQASLEATMQGVVQGLQTALGKEERRRSLFEEPPRRRF